MPFCRARHAVLAEYASVTKHFLRTSILKLYPTALENLPRLRLMLDNKIVPKKEVDDLLAQATEANHAETAALLLEYSQIK